LALPVGGPVGLLLSELLIGLRLGEAVTRLGKLSAAQQPAGALAQLGQPPTTVKGQRGWRQAVARIEQYRERYAITDPDRALGPEPPSRDLEQRRHHRAAAQVIQRLHERQRAHREQRLDRRGRAHPDQPPTRPTRAYRARIARVDEPERGGREREAG
ncbi:MAG TPA: hypothetical protein VEL76_33225, partial [Gemmataceae bacterium]|nr:hypothetical protein [Gemmataceae bacterium]